MATVISVNIEHLICLQLAAAATSSKDGVMSVKSLYNNIKRFSKAYKNLEYTDFLAALEDMRSKFSVPNDGEIGVDINYLSINK